jgi:1-acyl-sn-glycerol-3-phosphate acyltransferase
MSNEPDRPNSAARSDLPGQSTNVRARRIGFALPFLSHAAKLTADGCLFIFVLSELARVAGVNQWAMILFALSGPFIVWGCLIGVEPRILQGRRSLALAAWFCLAVAWISALPIAGRVDVTFCSLVLAFYTIGVALHFAACRALMVPLAQVMRLPVARVVGALGMMGMAGLAVGIALGWYLHERFRVPTYGWMGKFGGVHFIIHPALLTCAILNFMAWMAAAGAVPSSDRNTAAMAARHALPIPSWADIFGRRDLRILLLGHSAWFGLLASCVTAIVLFALSRGSCNSVPELLLFAGQGASVGFLVAGLQGHPIRGLGLVPLSALGIFVAVMSALLGADPRLTCCVLGAATALGIVPLATNYLLRLPAVDRAAGASLFNATACVAAALVVAIQVYLSNLPTLKEHTQIGIVAGLALAAILISAWTLLREFLELLVEFILWPCYDIRSDGPGRFSTPPVGPILVIANHTAWLDPLWLAKVIPRRVTPMMTSKYYDVPILHWLMVHVVQAIRVQASTFRREAPELADAVSVLDRGGCLIIFPEGFVKRKEELPLRNFGQGVWRILTQRPATPVVVCWIEGGWGSYTSHYHGEPMTNKPLDRRRPIRVAIEEPQVLPGEVLGDQRATRTLLMRACLEARRHIGLEPLQLPHAAAQEVAAEDSEE